MIKKFTLFLTISFLVSGCSHNKTLLFNKINYVKPPVCKMKKIEFKEYKAHIQENNVLSIDEKNLTILIENILIERKENKRFSKCLEENNLYYKKVLDIVLK